MVKTLYDFSKSKEDDSKKSLDTLPELLLEGMDEEQIWQQLELQNSSVFPDFITTTSKLLSFGDSKLNLGINEPTEEDLELEEQDEMNSDFDEEESENELGDGEEDESEDEDLFTKSKKKVSKDVRKPKKSYRKTAVDDSFFKLNEMAEFLEMEDRKEMNRQKGIVEENSDDEDFDMFAGTDDEELDEEEEDEALTAKFSDYFDEGDVGESEFIGNENEDEENVEEEEENKSTKVKFDLSQNKYKSDSDDDEDEIEEEEENQPSSKKFKPDYQIEEKKEEPVVLSSFEHREERLKQRIEKLENRALGERPWQLKGEIDSNSRPQNSLLEEILEFDSTVRPAPIITEETTMKLEDIIIRRIKDKAYDDVERKYKPTDGPQEFRKKLVLDQEKSKESLAQIYEKEYVKQIEALNPNSEEKEDKEPKAHTEIKSLMTVLFKKLDALANFHYTPKAAVPDVKIITNTPAINMEEVAPIAVANSVMLAPEEIKNKTRGELIGDSEKTKTDKNRERRSKKLHQKSKKQHEEEKEKIRQEKGFTSNKKVDQKKLLEKVIKSRNVSKVKESNDSKALKSSTGFFSQLQDEVQSKLKGKKEKKKKDTSNLSAKKMKL